MLQVDNVSIVSYNVDTHTCTYNVLLKKAKINYSFKMNYPQYYSQLIILILPRTKKCYSYYIHWMVLSIMAQ